MTYKKTLYHRFLDWQLARMERRIEFIDKMLKFWSKDGKRN